MGGYRYFFNGQEADNEVLGEGVLHAFEYRMHDTRVGRFWSVDPLAGKFPWNSVYAFAENMPIWARELEGLEAKIAIAGVGDIENTYYSKSDINAFEARALKLTKEGFDEAQVRNGVSLINTLKDATKKEGSILKIVSFAHSSENGIYLDYDEGFYSTLTFSPDKHYANVDMLVKEVSKGSVKFETDAVWIFASCNTARGYKNSLNPLALNVALKLNITTIGSTGPVYPEIVKGKETGRPISLRIATKKILLLHRRTIAYEPRPNISPRPPRPRTPSAGRGRLHAPSSAPIRGTRGDTPRPAPEGAPGNPRHRRFLPSFGPWRGWLLLPDLYRHFRIPSNCSLLTANC